ncbi:MAG: hypothetical protein KN64_01525 [Sulfurovum sp. AS07-7]|nr:MAG: hypothetical protein KN64_01525 [Sulfurovum sp. AS07-7]
MSKLSKVIKEIRLDGTKDGCIRVGVIEEPYGKDSESVVSIAVLLQSGSDEVDWKVHIPKENIDAVISALHEAKKAL